jgi:hypothetical protein
VIRRSIGIPFDSPVAANWIGERLRECKEHPKCAGAGAPKLPSRIIEISGTETDIKVRLFVTNGHCATYAALSYCWGGSQAVTTTIKTLPVHTQGLKFSSLSQTIQDAILVVSRLGEQYLWVDALCIVQDDPQDKMLEITKMDQYYKNAHITIIAGNAKAADDGFLHPRNPFIPSCTIPYLAPDGRQGSLKVSHRVVRDHSQRESSLGQPHESRPSLIKDPISRRAWTFQESILSPRKLFFGLRHIEWHCRHTFKSFSNDEQRVKDSEVLVGGPEPDFDFFTARPAYNPQAIYKTWNDAVRDYTSRSMSVSNDKLPAISAIARELQRCSGDRYLAGLWESSLLAELTWRPDRPLGSQDRRAGEADISPAPSYRAPSWSWASFDGRVCPCSLANRATHECAKVINAKIELASTQAPFGEVKRAVLIISAYLKRVPQGGSRGLRFPNFGPARFEGTAIFDVPDAGPEDTREAWYLWLFGRPTNEEAEEEDSVGDEFGMEEDPGDEVSADAIGAGDPEAASSEEEAEMTVSLGSAFQAENSPKAPKPEESETDETVMLDLAATGLIVEHVDLDGISCFRRIGVFDNCPGSWFFGETHTIIALI